MKLSDTGKINLAGLCKYWINAHSVTWLKSALKVDYNTVRNWERQSVKTISDNNFDRLVKFLNSNKDTLLWWININHGDEWNSWAESGDPEDYIPNSVRLTIELIYTQNTLVTYQVKNQFHFSPEIDKALTTILESPKDIDNVIMLLIGFKAGCMYKEKPMSISQILREHRLIEGSFGQLENETSITADRLLELATGSVEATPEEIRALSGCVKKTKNSYWEYKEMLLAAGYKPVDNNSFKSKT